jgi:RNA polymerase sigma factor (sigma-70 family)
VRTFNSVDTETFDTSVDELYRRHAGEALRVARSITRNSDDAADAVAEAFAGVVQALKDGRLHDPASLRAYLMAATRNAAIDVVRRARRVTPAGEDPACGGQETVLGPSDRLMAGADRSFVAEAFGELPPRWRAVLWLTEVEGYAPREAAVLMHVTPNNVAQLSVRARGRLRERFVQLHVRNHATGDCLETAERLGALVAGELTAAQARRVRAHLAECADCRARLAELEDLGLSLRRAIPLSLPLLTHRVSRRWWPWGSGGGRGQSASAWLGSVDPSTPAALVAVGSSPAVEPVVAAVVAGLVVLGVGAAVVHNPGPDPKASPRTDVAVAETIPPSSVPVMALAEPATTSTSTTTPPTTSTSTTTPLITAPPSTTPTTVASAGPVAAGAAPALSPVNPFVPRGPLASASSSVVAQALTPQLAIYNGPGASVATRTLANPQPSGAPLVLLVTEQRDGWLQVLLPVRPNGSTGWIRTEQVSLVTHDFRIIIELNAHRITAYQGRDVLLSEPIGVGTRDAPTPGGLYYIKELFQPLDTIGRLDPDGPYGPFAYGLSGFSEVLFDFAGGDGQFGIHGTNDPSSLGRDVSHGCIRMSNDGITRLARTLPLGVPVEILA